MKEPSWPQNTFVVCWISASSQTKQSDLWACLMWMNHQTKSGVCPDPLIVAWQWRTASFHSCHSLTHMHENTLTWRGPPSSFPPPLLWEWVIVLQAFHSLLSLSSDATFPLDHSPCMWWHDTRPGLALPQRTTSKGPMFWANCCSIAFHNLPVQRRLWRQPASRNQMINPNVRCHPIKFWPATKEPHEKAGWISGKRNARFAGIGAEMAKTSISFPINWKMILEQMHRPWYCLGRVRL